MEMVALLVVFFSVMLSGMMVDGNENISPMERELLAEQKLKQLNKPAIKSFQSEDGGIIDCVDIYKQPAFDHPLLKDHTIKLRPSFDLLQTNANANASPAALNSTPVFPHSWLLKESCPHGTVPIRRVLKQHLLNAPSIERFGMKTSVSIRKNKHGVLDHTSAMGDPDHHELAVFATKRSSYTGAKANINIWNPRVEQNDEYSTLQIWLENGPSDQTNTIEFGTTVNPGLYGDRLTRFFIFWTLDSGKKTGCYDVLCPGFVHVDKSIALGNRFDHTSYPRGQQYHIPLKVIMDTKQDAWWFILYDAPVGYWPAKIFNHMHIDAGLVKLGGDVYTPRLGERVHTGTEMGSGELATGGWGVASFIGEPRVMDETLKFVPPYLALRYVSYWYCYNTDIAALKPSDEPFYFFGGPGRSNDCREENYRGCWQRPMASIEIELTQKDEHVKLEKFCKHFNKQMSKSIVFLGKL